MRPGYSKVDPDRFSEVGCASVFRNRAPTAHPETLGRLSGVATLHFSGSATGAVTPVGTPQSALLHHLRQKLLGNAASSSRSRFLVNVVVSHTASSRFSPTNQRYKML
jgi:hypothetical protein